MSLLLNQRIEQSPSSDASSPRRRPSLHRRSSRPFDATTRTASSRLWRKISLGCTFRKTFLKRVPQIASVCPELIATREAVNSSQLAQESQINAREGVWLVHEPSESP